MSFIRRNRRTWPYAANSTGRSRGSLNLGPLATRVTVFEAIGEAREIFANRLSQGVIDYLHNNTELESASPVDLSLFMMGKSAERTKPVVMFISADKTARLEAYRAIKESGILGDFPGFDIGHMDLKAEYENFRPLADHESGREEIDDTPQQRLTESEKLSDNERHPKLREDRPTWPAERAEVFGRNVSWDGMLRLVQPLDESTSEISSATAGGILSYKGSYYLQSVSHFLELGDARQRDPLPSKPSVVIADSADCEVAGLSDFDEDEEDELANFTSRGSESPVSSHSETCDSETTEEDNSVVDQAESLADTVQSSLKRLAATDDNYIQRPALKYNGIMQKGTVVDVSRALDSSLIRIDLPLHPHLFAESQLRPLTVPLENYETHIETSARDAAINTTTSGGGNISGLLSGTPSFVRLSHSRAYRQVYVCKLHRPLSPGDCGAWVRDTLSGKVFGHIIAGSPTTGLAWVMPALDVFAHARSTLENLGSTSKLLPYGNSNDGRLSANEHIQHGSFSGPRFPPVGRDPEREAFIDERGLVRGPNGLSAERTPELIAPVYARFTGQNAPGLYLVHPQDAGQNCTCDIFVIHGFQGGATKSWQHQSSGVIWFRDLLPNLIRGQTSGENARIWTFGYPANIVFQTSTIYDFALTLLNRVKSVRKGYENRRIVWIGHSLGGLIIKKALIDAEITPRFRSIRTSTCGIIFLGTPHQGSLAANLGDVVASIVSMSTPGFRLFNGGIVRELKKNNNNLLEISSRFSNICAGISIHSFYETVPQGGAQLIVDRNSAILNLTNEVTRYPLNMCHQDMGKFRDAYDQNWLPVASSIMELVLSTVVVPTPGPHLDTTSANITANMSRPSSDDRSQQPGPASQPAPTPPSRPDSASNNPFYSQAGRSQPSNPSPEIGQQTRRPYQWSPPANASRFELAQPRPNQANTSRSQAPWSSSATPSPSGSASRSASDLWAGPESSSPEEDDTVVCDVCGRWLKKSEPRVQCTVCYDYDLCLQCFEMGKQSKKHNTNHRISHVLGTQVFKQEDLVPVRESVNPEHNATGTKANWTVEEVPANTESNPTDQTVCTRTLHLFGNDSHARFRASSQPGHYGIAIHIAVRVDKDMPASTRQLLARRPGGLGKLRVTLGPVRNNQQFFGTKFTEDSFTDSKLTPNCLPNKLLQRLWGAIMQINIDDTQLVLKSESLLHVYGPEGSSVGLGLILQWSGVESYQRSNDPIVSLTVDCVRMDNVLNYDEPYIRASPPAQPRAAPPPAPPAAEEDDSLTAEEYLAAILYIQREVQNEQERLRREALIRQRLARQEKEKQEAVALLLGAALQEAAREQEQQRQQAELARFFRGLGL